MDAKIKTGLVSISFRQQSVENLVKLVSEVGLEGIEWGGDVHVPHGDVKRAEQVKRMTFDSGLKVSAYGSYYKFQEYNPDSRTKGPEMEAVLNTAEALGAPAIRIWAGETSAADASDSWWRTIVEKTKEFADHASRRGIRIDFEFHSDTLTDTNESTKKLLADINHPEVKTLWQPYLSVSHVYRLEGIRMLLDAISNIHCNYFAQDPWPHMHVLEEGKSEWMDYLNILQKSGTERWVSIEHVKNHAVENFAGDAKTLKHWVAEMNQL